MSDKAASKLCFEKIYIPRRHENLILAIAVNETDVLRNKDFVQCGGGERSTSFSRSNGSPLLFSLGKRISLALVLTEQSLRTSFAGCSFQGNALWVCFAE